MHECSESFWFGPDNTPFWVCRWNDRVLQSLFLTSNLEYAQHLSRVTQRLPMVLLRQLHDSLRVAEYA